jgi:hypothetical protein
MRDEDQDDSGSRFEILADDPRMASGDTQQCDRWTLWMSPALLPVSKSVNTDPYGLGELCLRESDKASKSGDILP